MLRFVWLLSLLGKPAMFFNPLFSLFFERVPCLPQ
jgi:hypothetical protein